jgi:hypothetical protein
MVHFFGIFIDELVKYLFFRELVQFEADEIRNGIFESFVGFTADMVCEGDLRDMVPGER